MDLWRVFVQLTLHLACLADPDHASDQGFFY